jgi:hypothetical protein
MRYWSHFCSSPGYVSGVEFPVPCDIFHLTIARRQMVPGQRVSEVPWTNSCPASWTQELQSLQSAHQWERLCGIVDIRPRDRSFPPRIYPNAPMAAALRCRRRGGGGRRCDDAGERCGSAVLCTTTTTTTAAAASSSSFHPASSSLLSSLAETWSTATERRCSQSLVSTILASTRIPNRRCTAPLLYGGISRWQL